MRDTKIEMRWRFKTWPSEHYSKVIIDLTDKGDCTELALTQTGVPESDFDRTREGWKRYYWEAIKQTFGYGACLFWCCSKIMKMTIKHTLYTCNESISVAFGGAREIFSPCHGLWWSIPKNAKNRKRPVLSGGDNLQRSQRTFWYARD